MATDIFDIDEPKSFVRERLDSGVLVLEDLAGIEPVSFQGYDVQRVYLEECHHPKKQIRAITAPLRDLAEAQGHSRSIETGLYEAILNAHQHGNKKRPGLDILVGHSISPQQARFLVADHGNEIDARMAAFVLRHREWRHAKGANPRGYYDFIGENLPDTGNLGRGTLFMHIYFDQVNYFKSSEGGFAVELVKYGSAKESR